MRRRDLFLRLLGLGGVAVFVRGLPPKEPPTLWRYEGEQEWRVLREDVVWSLGWKM